MAALAPAIHRASLAALFVGVAGGPALAQEAALPPNPDYWADLIRILVGALVVATVLESALTVLFNWRVYRIVLNRRAWKTIFMVAAAAAVVWGFGYDPVGWILVLVGAAGEATGAESRILSALFLAGGTSGVNSVLRRLGFRSPIRDEPAPTLADTDAWFSVTLVRREAVGPVAVHLEELSADAPGEPLLAVVDDDWAVRRAFRTLFAQPLRFPSYGGRTVAAGRPCRIVVKGMRKADGDRLEPFEKTVWQGRFAPRAIADFHAEA